MQVHAQINNISEIPIIVLLVRSFNRPSYLKTTLQSLLNSDINVCIKRYIFDDGSDCSTTKNILKDIQLVNVPHKEFQIIYGKKNVGVRQSFLDALTFIHTNIKYDYLISVDNDIVVKPNFIYKLMQAYKDAEIRYKTQHILFTGFNPTNAHTDIIQKTDTYCRKKTIGAVNILFHSVLFNIIYDYWKSGEDWGICYYMVKNNLPICCLNNSVINHIGILGINSNKYKNYDTDTLFNI
jgi:cellulose synthase/poly-beta-1,6-N-acetylglucosamine synthase-like glycosyltransferase